MGLQELGWVRSLFPGFCSITIFADLKSCGTQASCRHRVYNRVIESPRTGQSSLQAVVASPSSPGADGAGPQSAVQQSSFVGVPSGSSGLVEGPCSSWSGREAPFSSRCRRKVFALPCSVVICLPLMCSGGAESGSGRLCHLASVKASVGATACSIRCFQ